MSFWKLMHYAFLILAVVWALAGVANLFTGDWREAFMSAGEASVSYLASQGCLRYLEREKTRA